MNEKREKNNSYYFFSQGELIEEVDADTDAEALAELPKRGYRIKGFFDYYTRYNRITKQMDLFKI